MPNVTLILWQNISSDFTYLLQLVPDGVIMIPEILE